MVWVIRYIVGVLIKHDAWDSIVEIPPTCNQLKSNTCKAKEPCMLISLKDQDLAMQWTNSTSPLLWLFSRQLEHPRNTLPLILHGSKQIWNFNTLCTLFYLRKELGSSLKSFSWVHEFTHQKKEESFCKSFVKS